MSSFKAVVVSSFVFVFISCNQDQQRSYSETQLQIQRILGDYYVTMSARDWESYQSFFIEDATLTTIWAADSLSEPSVFTNSISEFIAQTVNGPDSQPIFEERMIGSEISVKGNLAQAWVNYEAKFGSTDNLMEWTGKDLFSLIYFEGKWKIVSIVFAQD